MKVFIIALVTKLIVLLESLYKALQETASVQDVQLRALDTDETRL